MLVVVEGVVDAAVPVERPGSVDVAHATVRGNVTVLISRNAAVTRAGPAAMRHAFCSSRIPALMRAATWATLPITCASLGTSARVLWLRRRSCGYGRVRANEPRQDCGCDGRTGSRCSHVEVVLAGCWGAAQDARTWSRSALGEPGSAV